MCGHPLAPLLPALVFGDMAAAGLRQAMQLSQGRLAIVGSRPPVPSLAGLAVLPLRWPLPGAARRTARATRSAAEAAMQ